MRVMVIVKASKESEAGQLPDTELLTKMGKYNEQLVKAGIMLAADGLQASAKGKRVRFSGEKRHPGETEVEIRPVFEAADFGENFTPELREQERRLAEQIAGRK